MLSAEENKRIAEVGPGTPAGNWLRRYWHPVAISDAWDGQRGQWDWDEPVLFDGKSGTSGSWGAKLGTFGGKPTPVRILGEDLVLFRDGSGNPGLIQRTCPHRGTSFEFGRIHEDGIQCCYHGWLFDVGGACLAMPAEPADSTFKEKVRITSYPVQEMGGLLWAYMGPGEAPVLPRFDVYAEDAGVRVVENFGLWPTNYFQICENSVDQSHTGILHAGEGGERVDIYGVEIPTTTWAAMDYGIKATSVRPGVNHGRSTFYILPTMNRLPQPWPAGAYKWPRYSAVWRTPVDDHNTLLFSVCFSPEVDGKLPEPPDGAVFGLAESLQVHRGQDYQAICSQGPIFDRTTERLATSDEGVIMLRKMALDGIKAVEDGEDPLGVQRDPAAADQIIDLSSIVGDDLLRAAAE